MNILNEPTQGLILPTKICYLPTYQSHVFNAKYENFGSLACNQLHMFAGTYCKKKKTEKKKAILSTTTENLVTPAPPAPDKGSIREIATGEITVSIPPDDHLEGPYLLKTRELPGALPPGPPAGALAPRQGP